MTIVENQNNFLLFKSNFPLQLQERLIVVAFSSQCYENYWGPILYLLYNRDIPILEQTVVATFADDTAILAIGENNSESTQKLQVAITEVQRWTRKWRIKLNETKSVHIDFTNQRVEHKPIYINHHAVPNSDGSRK
jgi:hypothetical protein